MKSHPALTLDGLASTQPVPSPAVPWQSIRGVGRDSQRRSDIDANSCLALAERAWASCHPEESWVPTAILLFTLFTFDKTPEKCVKGKEVSEIPAH